MDTLIKYAIYLAIAAAAVGAVYGAIQGVIGWISAPRVEAQRKADEKVVEESRTKEKAALSDRDTARENARTCQVAADAQTQEVKGWRALAEKNFAIAAELKKKSGRDATAQAEYIAGLQADAGAKPKLMACDKELGLARDALADRLRRARGLPTTAAPAAAPPALVK